MACIVQQLSTLRVRTLRYTIRKRKRLTSLMCLQGSTYYGSVFLSWAFYEYHYHYIIFDYRWELWDGNRTG